MFFRIATRSLVAVPLQQQLSQATFATTARFMAAGDTGAPPKSGGQG